MADNQTLALVGAGILLLLFMSNKKSSDDKTTRDDPMRLDVKAPRAPITRDSIEDDAPPKKQKSVPGGAMTTEDFEAFMQFDGPVDVYMKRSDIVIKDIQETYLRGVWPMPKERMEQVRRSVDECNEIMRKIKAHLAYQSRINHRQAPDPMQIQEFARLDYMRRTLNYLIDANGNALNRALWEKHVTNYNYYQQNLLHQDLSQRTIEQRQITFNQGDQTFQQMNVLGDRETIPDEFDATPGGIDPPDRGTKRKAMDENEGGGANKKSRQTPDQEHSQAQQRQLEGLQPGDREPLPPIPPQEIVILDGPPRDGPTKFNQAPEEHKERPEDHDTPMVEKPRPPKRKAGESGLKGVEDVEKAMREEALYKKPKVDFDKAKGSDQNLVSQTQSNKRRDGGEKGPAEFNQTKKTTATPKTHRAPPEQGVYMDRVDKMRRMIADACDEGDEGQAGVLYYRAGYIMPTGGEMGAIRTGIAYVDGKWVEETQVIEKPEWLALFGWAVNKKTDQFAKLSPERQAMWANVAKSKAYKSWRAMRKDSAARIIDEFGGTEGDNPRVYPLDYYNKLLEGAPMKFR